MVSYIFKSKSKNIFVIIFSSIYLFIQAKDSYGWFHLAFENRFPAIIFRILTVLPPLLILVYMITLKREYKIKKWLFPAAFLVLAFNVAFSVFDSLILPVKLIMSGTASADLEKYFINTLVVSLPQLALVTGYVLAFFGALNNFKRVTLLRAGTILCAVFVFLDLWMGGLYLFNTKNEFLSILSEIVFYRSLLKIIIITLFYVSIFLLTLNKKSEDIVITPFVEARKAKRAAKAQEKLQAEAELEEISQEVPEGDWRCMGCGKVLPESENVCECGYKK